MNLFGHGTGALSIACYNEDPYARKPTFIIPIDGVAWRPGDRGVYGMPPTCADRLTVQLATSVVAFHFGLLGVPAHLEEAVILLHYTVHWSNGGLLGDPLTEAELAYSLSEQFLAHKGLFIVPTSPEPFDVFSANSSCGVIPSSVRSFVAKAFEQQKSEESDGSRPGKQFREAVLENYRHVCSISGDPKPDAAHIIDRYVGSPILFPVLAAIRAANDVAVVAGADIAMMPYPPIMFADIRSCADDYPALGRIDQPDNGETLSQFIHRMRDFRAANSVNPCTGQLFWFDLDTAPGKIAITDFGDLVNETTSTPATARLFSNSAGIQPISSSSFTLRCLNLYIVFCKRFMLGSEKSKIRIAVAEAARIAAGVHPSTVAGSAPAPRTGAIGDGGKPVGSSGGGGAGSSEADDGSLPASTSSDSNTTSRTLAQENMFTSIWPGIMNADQAPDTTKEELAAAKAGIERAFPHLFCDNFDPEFLQSYHDDKVLSGILLLHLGAAIQARLPTPSP
ncbi:hypothetical protein FB451DRAFT_1286547 [Mycena latifolia]|nr:hypothetical protein FB451DRAFT_1286547 [Mycena latifolia]